MMRCPLCRTTMDRHDLARMGYNVSPKHVTAVAKRCRALQRLGEATCTARCRVPNG